MDLNILFMTCPCCIVVVELELTRLNIQFTKVVCGMAYLTFEISDEQYDELNMKLQKYKLKLTKNEDDIIADKICLVIIEMIRDNKEKINENYSDYIANKMHYSYDHLATIYKRSRSDTIMHFIILTKTEQAKIMLTNGDVSMDDIAHYLHYSSTSHFSKQFKKGSGYSPRDYQRLFHLN